MSAYVPLTSVDELAGEQAFDTLEPKRGGWALIEIMGHRSHHGFVREVVVFGAAMCEVLVPFHDKSGVQFRHVYGGASIFSITPSTRADCMENAPRPFPAPRYPALGTASEDDETDSTDFEDTDEGD